jgi:CspA family cold shock protein
MQGTIAKVVTEKGFGFIKPEGKGKDLFFHASGMADRPDFDELAAGDVVTYDVDTEKDRPRAINVSVV